VVFSLLIWGGGKVFGFAKKHYDHHFGTPWSREKRGNRERPSKTPAEGEVFARIEEMRRKREAESKKPPARENE
jgi:hypothetical protein